MNEDTYVVPPVTRAISLIRHIAAGNRCRNISRTAQDLRINRTSLIRLLATLERETLIEQIPDQGGYQLGTGLIALAYAALNDRDILHVARPVLRTLVERLGLSAHFGVLEGYEIVYLARETPNSHLASMVREGTRLPAHATTIGRILLAEMPPPQLRQLYAGYSMESYSSETRTSVAELEVQLRSDREAGIAWSVANFEREIGSAAVPVYNFEARAVGAINVTGHASMFAPGSVHLLEIEAGVRMAAREMSEALGYRGWATDQM